MSRNHSISLALLACIFSIPTQAGAVQEDSGEKTALKTPYSSGFFQDMPDWLGRVRVEGHLDSDNAPEFSLETTQPIWQSQDLSHTVFTQDRVGFSDDQWTINMGGGYRYLLEDRSWIFGGNAFYDIQATDDHHRWGIGVEALQSYLTFRFNNYTGITGWKTIESAPNYAIQERAMSGYDFQAEGPVPYLPWARLSGTGYRWDATSRSDILGATAKLSMNVSRSVVVDVGGGADNAGHSVFTKLRLSLGEAKSVESTMMSETVDEKPFKPRDLSKHTLDRVERQNTIVTERRTVAVGSVTGVGVVIRRGN